MPPKSRRQTVVVTGANGYIGNAVARAFVRAGWLTYGLLRSASGAQALEAEEVLPVAGSIDDVGSHGDVAGQLPSAIDVIVSTTEDLRDYVAHYNNTIALLRTISSKSAASGVVPLVIFTSGVKDYGPGPHFANDPRLAPHTEESPLNPPSRLAFRTEHSMKIFDHKDAFSPVLVRPTNVHGRSSSFAGIFFELARKAADAGEPLLLPSHPEGIFHCMHVDDCGDAYVAIASHPARGEVEGQVFNISAGRYETVDEVARALASEYGIAGGLEYVDPAGLAPGGSPWPPLLINFPQWVCSEKVRRVTGWSDRRPLLTEALHAYRAAYEAAKASGHENVQKVSAVLSRLS